MEPTQGSFSVEGCCSQVEVWRLFGATIEFSSTWRKGNKGFPLQGTGAGFSWKSVSSLCLSLFFPLVGFKANLLPLNRFSHLSQANNTNGGSGLLVSPSFITLYFQAVWAKTYFNGYDF